MIVSVMPNHEKHAGDRHSARGRQAPDEFGDGHITGILLSVARGWTTLCFFRRLKHGRNKLWKGRGFRSDTAQEPSTPEEAAVAGMALPACHIFVDFICLNILLDNFLATLIIAFCGGIFSLCRP